MGALPVYYSLNDWPDVVLLALIDDIWTGT